MSKLYLVGTPIGNLGDFSPRGREVLETVDFIAAEDTRVTAKLLARFDIQKSMVSYHQHNARTAGAKIVGRLLGGESAAIVSDAGMPCISDPGEMLVDMCFEAGVEIEAVPGPSAVTTALAVSGLPTARFAFEGFLSTQKKARREHLASVANLPHTLVFYEAPHKLKTTLKDLLEKLGDRPISLCRELTKLHEEVVRTTLAEAQTLYGGDTSPKGEFVLVIEGAQKKTDPAATLEQAMELAQQKIKSGLSPTAACKEAAKETGYKKSDIYNALQQNHS